MTHVPYKGISMATTALASGEVEIVIASSAALTPAQLDGLLVREIDRYKKAAQVAGIPPQ